MVPTALIDPATQTLREKVFAIESQMRGMLLAGAKPAEIVVRNYYSDGVYAREITIPKGTCLTGRIHKFKNLNILVKGEMSVLTEDGIKRVKAGFTVVSPPGTKRIAYAHEECVWTTILRTDQIDADQIQLEFTVSTEDEYLQFQQKQLEGEQNGIL